MVRGDDVRLSGAGSYLVRPPRSVDSTLEGTMPRTKKAAPLKRKSAVRKNRTSTNAAGKNRAKGVRMFVSAGRPSKDDFVKVYGPDGPKMTWEQRAKAGVPAEKFQAALAKSAGR